MLKLLKNIKGKDMILVFISIIFVIVQVWLELQMPDYMAEITRLVQTPGSEMADILQNGAYMLACALGSMISAILVRIFINKSCCNFFKNYKKKII